MREYGVLFLVVMTLFVGTFNAAEGKKMPLEDVRKAIRNLRKACMPKSGATKELVDNALKGDFPADTRLMCYQKCVLEMVKAMKNDQLRVNVMINQADLMLTDDVVGRVKTAISACADVKSDDGCELAWLFCKCFYEKDKEVYFLP